MTGGELIRKVMKVEGVIKVGYFQPVLFGQIDPFAILVFDQVPGFAVHVSDGLVPPVLQVSRVTMIPDLYAVLCNSQRFRMASSVIGPSIIAEVIQVVSFQLSANGSSPKSLKPRLPTSKSPHIWSFLSLSIAPRWACNHPTINVSPGSDVDQIEVVSIINRENFKPCLFGLEMDPKLAEKMKKKTMMQPRGTLVIQSMDPAYYSFTGLSFLYAFSRHTYH